MRTRMVLVLCAVLALTGGVLALASLAGTAAATRAETGMLTFHGELSWRGRTVDCPSGTPSTVVCREHVGSGVIPGLGPVTERYLFLNQTGTAECPGNYRVLGLSVRFTAAKGAIDITTAPSTDCMSEGQSVTLNFPSATITGGSVSYAGASGTGTLRKTLNPGSIGAFGKDTWEMTLLVPGLAFDTTPPVLRGAVTKTVIAARGVKLVRVTYRVTALDETNGSVPVTCTPRPGTRFKVGRTVVNCSATDKSGNTGHAGFNITVKARR